MSAFEIIVWNNAGERTVYTAATGGEAERSAKSFRNVHNRTVKIAMCGESVDHWKRHSLKTQPNKWVRLSTAERSRA